MYLSHTTTSNMPITVKKSDADDVIFVQAKGAAFTIGLSRAEALELAAKLAAVAGAA